MNLHRFKRGFTKTNPEKGLRSLPGALKNERDPSAPSTIKVRGAYISNGYPRAGKFFAISGYILTIVYAIALSFISITSYISSGGISPLGVCLVGAAVVHGLAMAAEGVCHAESPWSQKSIKLFWTITALWLISTFIYLLISGKELSELNFI